MMVERICPRCERDNPGSNRFCGHCGAPLEGPEALPMRREIKPLAHMASRLPARWRPAGRVVALGVAAVAVEIGRAALQYQQQRHRGTAIVPYRPPGPTTRGRVVAVARRVNETWRGGELVQRSDEQMMWVLRDGDRE